MMQTNRTTFAPLAALALAFVAAACSDSASIRAGGGRIETQHLAAELRDPSDPPEGPRYRAGANDIPERAAIVAALEESHGGLTRAAALLGMSRTTLWRKLKSYSIDVHDHGAASP